MQSGPFPMITAVDDFEPVASKLNSMTRKRFVIPFVLCSILLTASWSYATTVQRLGLEDLVKKARTIVVGKVTNSRTYWSADGRFILTDYSIEVDESLKGQASRSIAVTTIGGKIG